jgi:hypothetical protein
LVLIFRRGKTWHMVLTHELPRHSIGGTLFGCRRWSGVLLFFRNSRHIIPYATLLDVTIFSHTAFHHPFLIGHPFIFALFHKFFGTRCVCEWCGGGRSPPGSLRKCGEMLDCYSCQHTTNEAKVIFHLWRRLQSFQSHPKTNENLCRLFLPVEPRSRISGGPAGQLSPSDELRRLHDARDVCVCPMLSKKSQTVKRLISCRITKHATIARRYALSQMPKSPAGRSPYSSSPPHPAN